MGDSFQSEGGKDSSKKKKKKRNFEAEVRWLTDKASWQRRVENFGEKTMPFGVERGAGGRLLSKIRRSTVAKRGQLEGKVRRSSATRRSNVKCNSQNSSAARESFNKGGAYKTLPMPFDDGEKP